MRSTANATFKRLVQRAGSVPDFARLIGRSRPLVWQIYNGKRPVPPGWVEGICAVCGVEPEDLRPDVAFIRGPDGRLYWRPK